MAKNRHPLFREDRTPAPLNRTLFLAAADRKRFSKIPSIPDLKHTSFARSLDHIYCGDCLEGLRALPNTRVNLVFADPPYNIGKDFGNNRTRVSEEHYAQWIERWLAECKRVLKPNGSIYVCSEWHDSLIMQTALKKHFTIMNRITWRREKGRGSARNWKSNMEDIWFCVQSDQYTFNVDDVKQKKEIIAPYKVNGKPKDWVERNGERFRMTHPSNIWVDTVVPFWSMHENTPHPTQKPELVLERIIKASSNVGDVVLDPFMGSGTTAVVAERLNRRYMGFELNPEYVMLAMKRLEVSDKKNRASE
ncbi:MAG: site-specific DNA-methyltransferase [Dehalococcoidia bacterium]|nr:site-specific DNA-methyltransferase [Dehalococcoidia bacterium]